MLYHKTLQAYEESQQWNNTCAKKEGEKKKNLLWCFEDTEYYTVRLTLNCESLWLFPVHNESFWGSCWCDLSPAEEGLYVETWSL